MPAAPVASAASRTRRHEWLVALPPAFKGDRNAGYTVRCICSNSVVMTRWEAEARAFYAEQQGMLREANWNQESVGCTIRHPIEELEIQLKLPHSLAGVFPYVCCERPTNFPNFPISQWGDAELPADSKFVRDVEMDRAEGRMPYFDKGIWRLTVKRPLVGYRYRLCWTIPEQHPDGLVPTDTREWLKWFLAMVDNPGSSHHKAQLTFTSLAEVFMRHVASGTPDENWNVELLVYDAGKLALRPVARRSSEPIGANWQQSSVAIGNGIAGAAFLRRLIVPWVARDNRAGPLKPALEENPDGNFQAILAVPLFHPSERTKLRPSPWGTIGVLRFSSSSLNCEIRRFLNKVHSREDKEMMLVLNGLADIVVHEMIPALGKANLPSADESQVLE